MANKTVKADNFVAGHIDAASVARFDNNTLAVAFLKDQMWPVAEPIDGKNMEVVQATLATFTMSESQAIKLAETIMSVVGKRDDEPTE